MTEIKIGDETKELLDGQHAIFDPAYPYIYVPGTNKDFKDKVGKMINDLYPTRFLTENACTEAR